MMNAAMMVGLGLLAQWGLPRVLGTVMPQNQAPRGPRLAGVEPNLPEDAYQGLLRALRNAPAKTLDIFEVELLRSGFRGAASVVRARADELRSQEKQRVEYRTSEENLEKRMAAMIAAAFAAQEKAKSEPKTEVKPETSKVETKVPANGKAHIDTSNLTPEQAQLFKQYEEALANPANGGGKG